MPKANIRRWLAQSILSWPRRASTLPTRKTILTVNALLLLIGLVAGSWGCRRNSPGQTESLSAAQAKSNEPIVVNVAQCERKDLVRQIALPASVEAFEQTTLYAKTSGYLKWLKVDVGDHVRKGQVIAQLDVPEMAKEYQGAEADKQSITANMENLQAEVERAKAELELKKVTYERYKGIREQEPDVMPQQQVDEARAQFQVAQAMLKVAESKINVAKSQAAKAEATRARIATLMEYASIRVPFDGIVIKRYVDPGALIQQASSQTNVSPLVTVARVNTLRIFIDVAEPEVRFVKRGSAVTFVVDALPGTEYEGYTTRFATLDPKTRTMRTEIDIPNRDGLLRPGMYGNVKLTLERRAMALTVPASAIISEGGKKYVYTVEDGRAKRVAVQTGFDDGINIEITDGLNGNEKVITSGTSGVKDGAPAKVVSVT